MARARKGPTLNVLLIDWGEAAEPRAPGVMFLRVKSEELRSLDFATWRVLILGDTALRGLAPKELHRLQHDRRLVCLLCPDTCSGRELAPWIRRGFSGLVVPEDIPNKLEQLWACPIGPAVEQSDWLPHVVRPNSDTGAAVRAVPDLNRSFSVQGWADELGWSRQRLWRSCMSSFGVSPKKVLWSYVETVVKRGRDAGMSEADLAALLGYSETSSLLHAFRRRGTSVPRKKGRQAPRQP